MLSTSSQNKNCATCEYWRGIRSISSNGKIIEYEQKGQCTSARSAYKGKETSGTQSCGHWLKWNALR